MNSTDSTTGPAAAPVPKDILDLFEGSINNATRMASILAFLLEQGLKSDMEDVTGARGKNMFHLVSEEREDIMFTIYRLQDAIGEIESAFEEAIR